jgi:hypothetical protein
MSPAESGPPRHRGGPPPGAAAALAAVAAWLAVWLAGSAPLHLKPGSGGWDRVRGLGPRGSLEAVASLTLPGLDRAEPRDVFVGVEAPGGGLAGLGVSMDSAPVQWVYARLGQGVVFPVPVSPSPGLRITFHPIPGAPPVRLRSLEVPDRLRWQGWPLAAGVACGLLTLVLARSQGTGLALGLGLLTGALLAFATIPAMAWTDLPFGWLQTAAPGLLLAGAAFAAAGPRRRDLVRRGALLTTVVLGAWVRLYFLPSTGSWDTEYWKAWMLRAAEMGVTQVYGGPDAVPSGHFLSQMRGDEPRWELEWLGRSFTVDYPPLAMALWRASWATVRALGLAQGAEAQNVAVKLPAVLGDVAAVALILWALRAQGRRAAWVAAAYWALPVSWLSSAVLGFLDGAVAPLVGAAVVAGGRGRPAWAGAWLAAACLVKPTAVVAAPAIVVALLAAGAAWVPALAAGSAVVAVALVPFAVAGTLATAIVHCYWILFQGTLSGGYPNVWWLAGHALAVTAGAVPAAGRVPFTRLEALPVPARPLGTFAFLAYAAWVARRQWRIGGTGAAALAAAALFLGYGMLAIGVHENHPHPAFLLFALTGLATRRLRLLAAGTAAVYVLNMTMLSGLGRFHGNRYLAFEGVARGLEGIRMAPGFDLTLVLAAANVALWGWMLARLGAELAALGTGRIEPTEG